MRKHPFPTVVLYDWVVPRLIVVYSRIVVPSPISTVVCSPLYLRSWGSPPKTVPTPTFTPHPSMTLRSRMARGAITHPSPTLQPSPTMAYAPISTPSPISADESMSAVG
jgi:hypothetical protein